MTTALVVSNVVLWIIVVVLTAIVVALVRQIGILYERVAPVGALTLGHGPVVGEAAPRVTADHLDGTTEEIGAPRPDGKSTLLFFLSTRCPVCKTLLPVLRSVARSERSWLRIVLASDGTPEEHRAFVGQEKLGDFPYVLSTALGMTYRVSKLPYAVLVDGAGTLRARGLVNSREHLESLFEAYERGVGSLQDFVQENSGPGEVARP